MIPGLIDAHVLITGVEPDIARYRTFLHALLLGGVTGMRNMAGDDRLLQYLADQANSDAFAAPDIVYAALMSGPSFFAEDPRAQAASRDEPLGFAPWMQAITARTNIPLAVAEAKGTGATGLKLYANLPAALVDAITAEARRRRRGCGGGGRGHHLAQPVPGMAGLVARPGRIQDARARRLRARVAGGPEFLDLFCAMKKRHTVLDATLVVLKNEAENHPGAAGAGIMPWSYAITRLAHRQGVLIDACTDDPGLPEARRSPDLAALPTVHQEMQLWVEHCGFTPVQAIQAATEVSAMALGQPARMGTIVPGKLADLVVLEADPSHDIRNTRRIAYVVKDGRTYTRTAAR